MSNQSYFLIVANIFFATSVLVPRDEKFKWVVLFGLGTFNLLMGITQ